MAQTSREEFLRDLEYEKPFDESPVDVPDERQGGAVVNTGGKLCAVSEEREKQASVIVMLNLKSSTMCHRMRLSGYRRIRGMRDAAGIFSTMK